MCVAQDRAEADSCVALTIALVMNVVTLALVFSEDRFANGVIPSRLTMLSGRFRLSGEQSSSVINSPILFPSMV